MRRLLVAAAATSVLATACSHRREPVRVPAGVVEIGKDVRVKTGPVGAGEHEAPVTYALIDATNRGDRDVVAALGGALLDAAGNELGPARPEVLRIPAGESRMFALVDGAGRRLPAADGAAIELVGAHYAEHDPVVSISQKSVRDDEGRAVAEGYVENRGRGAATIVVIAAFYDAQRRPLERAATALRIDPGYGRSTQLVGPPGSRQAALYLGDVGY